MAHRNLWRSLATASLLLVSTAAAGLVAPPPAGAAQNVLWTVTVRDDGFSQTTINARTGDLLVFQLDANAVQDHTLTWEQGQFPFSFRNPDHTTARYGPLGAGTLHFFDSSQVAGADAEARSPEFSR